MGLHALIGTGTDVQKGVLLRLQRRSLTGGSQRAPSIRVIGTIPQKVQTSPKGLPHGMGYFTKGTISCTVVRDHKMLGTISYKMKKFP